MTPWQYSVNMHAFIRSTQSNTLCQHLSVLFSAPKEIGVTQPDANRQHCKLSLHIYTLCTHSKFCFNTFRELLQYLKPIKLTLPEWTWKKSITLNHPKPSFEKQFESWRGLPAVQVIAVLTAASWKQINQFCLFIYPMKSFFWYMKSIWLGKQWGVIHIECISHSCMSHYQTTRLAL